MRLPDYTGGSIVNLMASLQEALGGSTRHTYFRELGALHMTMLESLK